MINQEAAANQRAAAKKIYNTENYCKVSSGEGCSTRSDLWKSSNVAMLVVQCFQLLLVQSLRCPYCRSAHCSFLTRPPQVGSQSRLCASLLTFRATTSEPRTTSQSGSGSGSAASPFPWCTAPSSWTCGASPAGSWPSTLLTPTTAGPLTTSWCLPSRPGRPVSLSGSGPLAAKCHIQGAADQTTALLSQSDVKESVASALRGKTARRSGLLCCFHGRVRDQVESVDVLSCRRISEL